MKKLTALVIMIFLVAFTISGKAMAQNNAEEVSANGAKGAVGLGLLAGELVVNIEAVAGVKKAWILVVTGLVAAGGGAAGGYFAETKPSEETGAKVGVGLLAGGMAFIVPTMIVATAMLKYAGRKEAGAEVEVVTEKAPAEEEESAGEEATEKPPAEEESSESTPPTAMINVKKKGVSLAVPPLLMVPVFSDEEVGFLTEDQAIEYRINILNLIF